MIRYRFAGKLHLEEYGQCGEDEFQISRPVVIDVSRRYREGRINKDGGRTIEEYQWSMGIKELACAVSGSDKASAELDRASERIWVSFKSDDFSGTVTLDYNGAQSLLADLESCTEGVRYRRERLAEKVR